jgi:hypothetical protein
MIVTSNGIQGDFVEKYQLGLSLDNCDNLDMKIQEYIRNFDYASFCTRCDALLKSFIDDYQLFEKEFIDYINL